MSKSLADEAFEQSVWAMAQEVVRFHREFDISILTEEKEVLQVLKDRLGFLAEEVGEHAGAMNKNKGISEVSDELADVLFIVLGSLHRAGYYGVQGSMRVTEKNKHKTRETHYKSEQSGKILRRELGGGEGGNGG